MKKTKKIQALEAKFDELKAELAKGREALQAEWNDIFNDLTSVKAIVQAGENADNYMWDEFGEVDRWAHVDLSPFVEVEEYFEKYLNEFHSLRVDWKNECVLTSEGDCWILSDDGDLTNSRKVLISRDEWKNEDGEPDDTKLFELIEERMEKEGFYPTVLRSDYYGNLWLYKEYYDLLKQKNQK